ncbi:hypothetical protein [Pontibacter chinhatensis]|nr:hypothetical protein [Pontibacter chinhatensis]
MTEVRFGVSYTFILAGLYFSYTSILLWRKRLLVPSYTLAILS